MALNQDGCWLSGKCWQVWTASLLLLPQARIQPIMEMMSHAAGVPAESTVSVSYRACHVPRRMTDQPWFAPSLASTLKRWLTFAVIANIMCACIGFYARLHLFGGGQQRLQLPKKHTRVEWLPLRWWPLPMPIRAYTQLQEPPVVGNIIGTKSMSRMRSRSANHFAMESTETSSH